MANAVINEQVGSTSFGSGVKNVSLSFTPTVGNTLIVIAHGSSGNVVTAVADNAGSPNSYGDIRPTGANTSRYPFAADVDSVPSQVSITHDGSAIITYTILEVEGIYGSSVETEATAAKGFGTDQTLTLSEPTAGAFVLMIQQWGGGFGAPQDWPGDWALTNLDDGVDISDDGRNIVAWELESAGGGDTSVGFTTSGNVNGVDLDALTIPAASVSGIDLATESLELTAQAATLSLGRTLVLGTEALELTAQGVSFESGLALDLTSEALELTAQAATLSLGRTLVLGAEALELTAQAASIASGLTLGLGTESLELAAQAASIEFGRSLTLGTEALELVSPGVSFAGAAPAPVFVGGDSGFTSRVVPRRRELPAVEALEEEELPAVEVPDPMYRLPAERRDPFVESRQAASSRAREARAGRVAAIRAEAVPIIRRELARIARSLRH